MFKYDQVNAIPQDGYCRFSLCWKKRGKMKEADFEGTLILERLAEIDQLDAFFKQSTWTISVGKKTLDAGTD